MNRKISIQDFYSICLITGVIGLFFYDIWTLRVGFYSGDHRVQHYPWAQFFWGHLRQFKLPWWTSQIHCGFPLLAEGQIGAFYPLNLLFYYLFPIRLAYSYEVFAHYALAGLFCYVYLRSLKLSYGASLLGTFVYLFGSAQGGYYYNITSQKVLVWLPLAFYLTDQIVEQKRVLWTAWLSLIFAVQIFAGYLQYAIYAIGFSVFYFLWFSVLGFWRQKNLREFLLRKMLLIGALILTGVIALPQLLSTWELAQFSNRASLTEAFAYLGSMNPLALVTLFYPHWDGFLGAEVYVGALGI
ncbi:MAG: hypothetical protein NC930_00480, partial [Candidatus Omnitrophica bacterium]|nr:hypothetical protein [Candidatus Omnitrophota bacterium]